MLMSELVHLCIATGLQDSSTDNLLWLINSSVMSHKRHVDQHSDGLGMHALQQLSLIASVAKFGGHCTLLTLLKS